VKIVFIGLSITSSWGNGHATTYRGLVRELTARGHDVTFLERDVPWYAANRDLPRPPFGTTRLYAGFDQLRERFGDAIRDADLVVVGSFVPEGVRVGGWVTTIARGVTAFYDIDTPVTLAKLAQGDWEYVTPELVSRYQLYLSFTAGPTLEMLERNYGSQMARALYCSVDPTLYRPQRGRKRWDLGYLGTYSLDRQPALDRLMLEPARRDRTLRTVVAGPMYPKTIRWPRKLTRIEHLPPEKHRAFYNAQRYTLNVTRRDMVKLGWSPSVRLFEAAACGTPIISDHWPGLGSLFAIGREILVASSPADTLRFVRGIPEAERKAIAARARARVLAEHTAAHRALELERHVAGVASLGSDQARPRPERLPG
jgi:spore maturation protein CgeB